MLVVKQPSIVSYGIDYLRLKVFSQRDVDHIQAALPYVDVCTRTFHGVQFVDVTGKQLELIRMFDDVSSVAETLAMTFPVHRLDVFVDVVGDLLPHLPRNGTTISNGGRVETIYSHHLSRRGDVQMFGRAYDAQAAKHYDTPVTRFEIEIKRESAKGVIDCMEGWRVNPLSVAIHWIKEFYDVEIRVDGQPSIEYVGKSSRLAHSRERFYKRYGKNILLDIERMGVSGLYDFIRECTRGGKTDVGRETQRDRNYSENWGKCKDCSLIE